MDAWQHAVEVVVYNLLSYLYEIEHRQVYTMTRVSQPQLIHKASSPTAS